MRFGSLDVDSGRRYADQSFGVSKRVHQGSEIEMGVVLVFGAVIVVK